jgi:hypothetical protein
VLAWIASRPARSFCLVPWLTTPFPYLFYVQIDDYQPEFGVFNPMAGDPMRDAFAEYQGRYWMKSRTLPLARARVPHALAVPQDKSRGNKARVSLAGYLGEGTPRKAKRTSEPQLRLRRYLTCAKYVIFVGSPKEFLTELCPFRRFFLSR